jgi:hypothetical protein
MSPQAAPSLSLELLRALPKTDLHVHLDGSVRLGTLIELAREHHVDLPSQTEAGLRELVFKERYRDLADYLGKLDRYTSLAAAKRLERGVRFRPWHHLVLPWEFFSRAVLRLGVLDGRAGLVWAGLSAFHGWLKYVKLAELEKEARP